MKRLFFALSLALTVMTVNLRAQQSVSVSGIDVDTVKVFDNNDTALVRSHGTLQGVEAGHNVYPYTEAHYDSVNASTGRTIYVTTVLRGSDSALYDLTNPAMTLTGSITKRQLYRDSVILHPYKIYDGALGCPLLFPGIARNYVTHHILTTIVSCLFEDPDVGEHKPVHVHFGINGEDEDNYLPPRDTVLESSIIKRKLLTKKTVIATTKQYDGTTDAVINSRGWFTNVLEDDTVYFNLSAYYEDKNVGTGKSIHTHFDIYGPDTMNYSAPDDGLYMNASITPIQLTAQGGTAEKSKEYDSTTYCKVIAPSQPVGVLDGEQVYLNTMASYDTSSVGTNHVITFAYTIYGNDALNYLAPSDSVYCTDGVIYAPSSVDNVSSFAAIWPNPFVDALSVRCGDSGEHHIIIYNVSGQQVYAESFSGQTTRINLSSLSSGIYLFVIDGRPTKLIKQ